MLEFNTGNSGALILGGRYNFSGLDSDYESIAREMDDLKALTACTSGKDSEAYKRVCQELDNISPAEFREKKRECMDKERKREALARYKALNDKMDPDDALAIARLRARDLLNKPAPV